MAAEIAGALAVGACCPGCASADHPQKASPAPGAPDGAAERSAQKALDDAKADEHVRDLAVRDLSTRLATAVGRAGEATAASVSEERTALDAEVGRLATTAERAAQLGRDLEAAVAAERRLDEELHELDLAVAALESRTAHRRGELADLRAEVDAL